jgi:hypothetical protein
MNDLHDNDLSSGPSPGSRPSATSREHYLNKHEGWPLSGDVIHRARIVNRCTHLVGQI